MLRGMKGNPPAPRQRSDDPVARRIRERRQALGLSLVQLARHAEIKAPSYIFHIENSQKVPSEEVAARLARALQDDEELYRAWARAHHRTDLRTTLSAARVLERLLADPSVDKEYAAAEDVLAFSLHQRKMDVGATAKPAPRVAIPVLEEGEDPGDDP